MIQIKRWDNGEIIYQSETATTVKEAIREAAKNKILLTNANLTNANLRRANLTNANLTNADLTWADLTNANLTRANLTNTNLDFCGYPLWCGSLKAILDEKHIIQLLGHAFKPYENHPKIVKDKDLKRLLDSKMMQKVLMKAHRSELRQKGE